jgi:hypothetical protein
MVYAIDFNGFSSTSKHPAGSGARAPSREYLEAGRLDNRVFQGANCIVAWMLGMNSTENGSIFKIGAEAMNSP